MHGTPCLTTRRRLLSTWKNGEDGAARFHIVYLTSHTTQDEPCVVSKAIFSLRTIAHRGPSLDTIGIAGFSHDFKTLEGQESSIANVFAAFGRHKLTLLEMVHLMLLTVFPILWRFPTSQVGLAEELSSTLGAISETLLTKTRGEKINEEKGDRSIMGLLRRCLKYRYQVVADDLYSVRASGSNSELRVTDEEVLAQMKVLIVAGECFYYVKTLHSSPVNSK